MGQLLTKLREPIAQVAAPRCPRPEKRAYLTEDQAKAARREAKRGGRGRKSLEVYLCGCGVYHLGNPPMATS